MDTLPWISAVVAISLLAVVVIVWAWLARRPPQLPPLPTEWALSARPVFTTDERRVFKLLKHALPDHIVLSKLPLVRFSQPSNPVDVRYWYDLLGAINVTFAICSPNGRVLAAIDLDTERNNSRRILQIKQSVLGTCRVRYLRCASNDLPSAAELQQLVPNSASAAARMPIPGGRGLDEARDSLATTVASRRAERSALWQDSSLFQDSFFAPDSRQDGFGGSDFAGLAPLHGSSSGNGRQAMNDDGQAHVSNESTTSSDGGADPDGGGVVVVEDGVEMPATALRH